MKRMLCPKHRWEVLPVLCLDEDEVRLHYDFYDILLCPYCYRTFEAAARKVHIQPSGAFFAGCPSCFREKWADLLLSSEDN